MYSLRGSRHQNTIQQTRRASIDTAVFLARTGAVSHVSECLCVSVWVCVRTYLNIISQTCQVASVPAIQRDNGSLGSASVRIFCDCVWICVCVCVCSRGRPNNETRHMCHLLRCLFFGFCNPGWKTHLSPFRHRCLQSRDDVHACAG